MMHRNRCALLLLPLMLLAASCAPRFPAGCFPPLAWHWPAQEQVMRHRVRIDFSGTAPSFSFDGILRLRKTEAGPEIRVVCLGAFGLTLCDMTVTPDGYRTDVLHPSLAKMPHAAEHIAFCVGSVWFAAAPPPPRVMFYNERAGYTVTIKLIDS